jgi:hypothetical protein
MQSKKASIQDVLTSKPKLLMVVSALVLAILSMPVIIPHISHPSMIYHIILHIVSLIIAIFLTVISMVAYKKTKSTRIFFMTLGFFSLIIAEFLYLFNATENIEEIALPLVHIELPHVILLTMLTLFSIGILKVNMRL